MSKTHVFFQLTENMFNKEETIIKFHKPLNELKNSHGKVIDSSGKVWLKKLFSNGVVTGILINGGPNWALDSEDELYEIQYASVDLATKKVIDLTGQADTFTKDQFEIIGKTEVNWNKSHQ